MAVNFGIYCVYIKNVESSATLIDSTINELYKDFKGSNRIEYLTRADDMQYKLTIVIEGVSDKIIVSLILKGLPKENESFTILVKKSKVERTLEDILSVLINFDNKKVKRKTENVFLNKKRKCFNCQKMG